MYLTGQEAENKEILRRYRSLLRTWSTRKTPRDVAFVRKAFNLAVEAHKDMRRRTGEPYIYHPLEVASIVAGEIGLGATSIICALLHDVVEDTDYSLNDIRTQFGDKIARIIDGLTKIEEIFDHTSSSLQAENFKKMLLTLSDDVRVILIKLADRLHNMRTLDAMPKQKQLKIASETIYLYAPLALRLGLYRIKTELEDMALKYTEPDIFETISEKIKSTENDRKAFVRNFSAPIKKDLKEQGIQFSVEADQKSVYSIWEKMKSQEIPFEEVFDTFSIRFIIKTLPKAEKVDCWRVYTIVTDHYRPNVEKLRDWISIPKANGYEALHVTVMSKKGRWVEIQIRSGRMHEIAEKGYVALWKYKSSNNSESGLDEWLRKIREVLNAEDTSAIDFISDIKLTLFSDEIFVFTPRGDMKSLPKDSTVLDFAYNIHTQVGNESIGAKVNHKLVPLSHKLKSGDQVEIITSKKQIPREEWFGFVATARAKSRIKHSIKDYRKTFKESGRKQLKKIYDGLSIEFTGANVQKLQHSVNLPSSIDLYYQVANNNIGFREVKTAFPDGDRGWLKYITRPFSKSQKSLSENIREKMKEKPESLIIGGDSSSVNYKIARCCNPIPGDDVIGFINGAKPIEVHQTNCPDAISMMSKYAGNMVKAKWLKKESISFLAGFRVIGIDQLGLINQLTEVISNQYNLNIRSIHIESTEGVTQGDILIYVPNNQILNTVMNKMKQIKEIKKITRLKRLS